MIKLNSNNSEQKLRVAFETLGCRSNYADTVDLQTALVEKNVLPCEWGDFSEESLADVYVLNTCTVTNAADREAYRLIKKVKAKAPQARIVVTGCLAETGREGLAELGLVDAVVGPGRKQEVITAILKPGKQEFVEETTKLTKLKKRESHSISLTDPISAAVTGPGTRIGEVATRARYHLRVQEGCENSCTFCIIPASRGMISSRKLEDVLADLRHLAEVGYQEVVLTGTHLGGYGQDIGLSLLELLQGIEAENRGLRVRLSSIDPNDLSSEIVGLIAKSNVFCHHLHICVQAFSDYTLKRMNRRYRLVDVLNLVDQIVEKMPWCGLGSDLITGFPGEGREELEQAIEVFLDLPFSYLHVFPYSEREGTAATRLDNSVEPKERKRRAARWRALSQSCRRKFAHRWIGSEIEAVVEGISSEAIYGTTREYVSIKAANEFLKIDSSFLGKRLKLTATTYNEFEGVLECQLLNQENWGLVQG